MALRDVRNRFVTVTRRQDLQKNELVLNGSLNSSAWGWDLQEGWSFASASLVYTPADALKLDITDHVGGNFAITVGDNATDGTIVVTNAGSTPLSIYKIGDYVYIENSVNTNDGYYFVKSLNTSTNTITFTTKLSGTDNATETAATLHRVGLLRQLQSIIPLVTNSAYFTSYTIPTRTAGSIQIALGQEQKGTSQSAASATAITQNILCSTPPELIFFPTFDFAGSVDDISIVLTREIDDNDNGLQAGADWYLNAGQRLLDSMVDTTNTVRRFQTDLTVGEFKVEFFAAKAILRVWVANADGRQALVKMQLEDMKTIYAEPLDEVEVGTPVHYAIGTPTLSPQQKDLTSGNFTDEFTYESEDIAFPSPYATDGSRYTKRQVLIMPPTDETVTIVVESESFSNSLVADADKSYWTEIQPELLVQAACIYLYGSDYANTQKMRHYREAVEMGIRGINLDSSSEAIADLRLLEG